MVICCTSIQFLPVIQQPSDEELKGKSQEELYAMLLYVHFSSLLIDFFSDARKKAHDRLKDEALERLFGHDLSDVMRSVPSDIENSTVLMISALACAFRSVDYSSFSVILKVLRKMNIMGSSANAPQPPQASTSYGFVASAGCKALHAYSSKDAAGVDLSRKQHAACEKQSCYRCVSFCFILFHFV